MLADRVSDILSLTGQSLKSLVKLAIQSQQPSIKNSDHNGKRLIILGNGPSLADNLANDMDILLPTTPYLLILPPTPPSS